MLNGRHRDRVSVLSNIDRIRPIAVDPRDNGIADIRVISHKNRQRRRKSAIDRAIRDVSHSTRRHNHSARTGGHILTRSTKRERLRAIGKHVTLNRRCARQCTSIRQRDRLARTIRNNGRERIVLGNRHRDVLASSNLQRTGVVYDDARDVHCFGQYNLVRWASVNNLRQLRSAIRQRRGRVQRKRHICQIQRG